jgi:CRP/FNR family transcriptional regulator, cyclic AMP receptor protein
MSANDPSRSSVTDYGKNQTIFSQGDAADSVFYIQEGKVKVTVIDVVRGLWPEGATYGTSISN